MRVLMVHAARDSANEYKVHRLLATSAAEHGVELHFLCQDSPLARAENESLPQALRERITYAEFGRDMHSTPKPTRLQRALLMGRALPTGLARAVKLARALKPDLIYGSQQKFDVFMGRALAKALGKPRFVHLHYTVGPWLGGETLRGIRRARRVICVSEFIRRQAIEAGVPSHRARTLLNGADLASFDLPRSRDALRAAFGWADDAPVVIAAGRIDPSKGHLPLLDAFAIVLRDVPQAKLLVCGTTTTRDGYEQTVSAHAERLNLGPHVVFAGSRSDLPALFAGADVMCLPTEGEPFGLVFLEAMAAGLPTVAYRSGGVPEIVQDGQTGFLVSVGDVSGLAERLTRLLKDRSLATRLGAAGKQRATSEFDPKQITRRWAELLRDSSA
jgi:glycosyltransferase involved in cell wall biosynthesis